MSFEGKSSLLNGEELRVGEQLTSPDERIYLILQPDGCLALFRKNDPQKSIWKSTIDSKITDVQGPFILKMQENNDAVVYDGKGQSVWHTATQCPDFPGLFHLEVDDDDGCYVRGRKNEIVWTSYTGMRCFREGKEGMSVLDKGQELCTDQCLVSSNEHVCLMVDSDGHIALYKTDNYDEPIWQSTIDSGVTSMEEPFVFKITDDNNIAIYDTNRQIIWKTNVSCINSDCRLVLQDDGCLQLHLKDDTNSHVWSMKDGNTVCFNGIDE
ncbi:hypothetical protein I4U23_013005 [Adineta vaga]|nr:hypothetical protein I4U23_013005 [Adineta vaga]